MDSNKTIEIKPGQIFTVGGKIYAIANPILASDDVNEHGQIIYLLFYI